MAAIADNLNIINKINKLILLLEELSCYLVSECNCFYFICSFEGISTKHLSSWTETLNVLHQY